MDWGVTRVGFARADSQTAMTARRGSSKFAVVSATVNPQLGHRPVIDALGPGLRQPDMARAPCRKAEWQCNIARIFQRGRKRRDGGAPLPRTRPLEPVERSLDRELAREVGDVTADEHLDPVHLTWL